MKQLTNLATKKSRTMYPLLTQQVRRYSYVPSSEAKKEETNNETPKQENTGAPFSSAKTYWEHTNNFIKHSATTISNTTSNTTLARYTKERGDEWIMNILAGIISGLVSGYIIGTYLNKQEQENEKKRDKEKEEANRKHEAEEKVLEQQRQEKKDDRKKEKDTKKTEKQEARKKAEETKIIDEYIREFQDLRQEYSILQNKMAKLRHNITVYSGVTPQSIQEFEQFKEKHSEISGKYSSSELGFIRYISRTIKSYLTDKNSPNKNIDEKDIFPQILNNLSKEKNLLHDLIKEDKKDKINKKMNHLIDGLDKYIDEIFVNQHLMMLELGLTRDIMESYIGRTKEINQAMVNINDTMEKAGGSLLVIHSDEDKKDNILHLQKEKHESAFNHTFYEALDANLLMMTDNNKTPEAFRLLKFIYTEEESFKPENAPYFIYNRIGSFFMRCQANNIPFNDELVTTINPKLEINNGTNYDKWAKMAKIFLKKAKANSPENNAIGWSLLAVCDIRDMLVKKRIMDNTHPVEKADEYQKLKKERNDFADQAMQKLDRAINLEPNNPVYLRNRGWLHLENNDPHKAMIDINKALQMNDGYTSAHAIKANILSRQGKHAEARTELYYVPAISRPITESLPIDNNILPIGNNIIEHEMHTIFAKVLWNSYGIMSGHHEDDLNRARYHIGIAAENDRLSSITAQSGGYRDKETTQLVAEMDRFTVSDLFSCKTRRKVPKTFAERVSTQENERTH